MIFNCFGKDADALKDIKELFMQSLMKLAKDGKNIDFKSVYSDVMNSNVIQDIDIESAAYLYQETRTDAYNIDPHIGTHMTSEAELDKIASDANLDNVLKSDSKDSPAMAISKGLMRFLTNASNSGRTEAKEVSRIKKIIQDYAKSIVSKSKNVKIVDLLAEALDRDMNGDAFGLSYDAFFDNLKKELSDTLSRVKDPVVRKGLESELRKIQKASFKMGITESGRKKILYDALKASRYGKDVKKGGKTHRVVDWNAIARSHDPIAALKSVLSDKLDSLGYKGDKNKVYDALKDEIEDIRRTKAYLKAVTLTTHLSLSKLNDEVAISRGFYRMVDGKKVVDYGANNIAGKKELETEMKGLGLVYDDKDMKKNFDVLVNHYIKTKDIKKIEKSILKLMAFNNKPFKSKIGEIDRLVKLKNIAGMDGTTSMLAGKILDMKVNAVVMARMESLVKQYEQLMSYNTDDIDQFKLLFPLVEFDAKYTPAVFASTSAQVITKEIAVLVRAAAVADQALFVRTMDGMVQWQQLVLANALTNTPNIINNIGGAIVGSNVAGKDVVRLGKKWNNKKGGPQQEVNRMKEMINVFKTYWTHDYNAEHGSVRGSGIKNMYDANTTGEKALAGIRMLSSGLLSAIDGIAAVNGVSRSFYKGIYEDLRIKFRAEGTKERDLEKRIDEMVYPYFSAEYSEKAVALAKEFLGRVGITEASVGKDRYGRILEAEAENVRRSFFMTGPITKYINPERVQLYKKSAERLTEMELGRKDYNVVKKGGEVKELYNAGILGINIATKMRDKIDGWYNDSFDDLLAKNTRSNTWKFLAYGLFRLIMHGGPLAFMGGATRWADKALGSAINMPIYALTGKVGSKRGKFQDIIGEELKKDGKEHTPEDIMATYEEFDIARRRMQQSIFAYSMGAAILVGFMAIGEDDDDDEWWVDLSDKVKDGMGDFGDTPIGDLILRRIVPFQIRVLYAMSKLRKSWKTVSGAQANIERLSPTLYTQVPSSVESLATRYWRHGDTPADVGAKIMKEITGAIFGLSPIFNLGGWAGIVNPFIDQLHGSKKKVSFANHPALDRWGTTFDGNFWDGVNDGMMWGFSGYSVGYAMDKRGMMRTTGMEILPEDYNKSFSQINWDKYGESKYNESKKDVEDILLKLDQVAGELEALGKKYNIPDLDKPGDGQRSYERYYPGIYSVPTKHLNSQQLSELKKYSKGEKPSEAGNINALEVALNRVGLKKKNLEDAYIAIKWKNLQKKLLK